MYTPCGINDHPRTQRFIEKCEDILFWNLKGCVSKGTERFLESVHKQMVKYPERYPTEKQATVIDQIHNDALDEMAREGRYAFHILPLRHKEKLSVEEPDALERPKSMPPLRLVDCSD